MEENTSLGMEHDVTHGSSRYQDVNYNFITKKAGETTVYTYGPCNDLWNYSIIISP
ncbi:MAG: hypothetical protein V1909_00095 [Candidatus Micrarchaeota archaeon]